MVELAWLRGGKLGWQGRLPRRKAAGSAYGRSHTPLAATRHSSSAVAEFQNRRAWGADRGMGRCLDGEDHCDESGRLDAERMTYTRSRTEVLY